MCSSRQRYQILMMPFSKRRRNTEASARFRAKKKEREQALEQRASAFHKNATLPFTNLMTFSEELETQVAQLTADKASLENQNKLLKEIVLGGGTLQGQENLQAVMAAIGAKRKRE